MAERGLDFAVALQSAQQAGYAEADPTLDINGEDAAHKLAILATLSFGVRVHPAHIATEGIDVVDAHDIRYAKSFGYAIRPMAIASRTDDHVLDLRVHPALVSLDNPLAHITGALNAVSVRGERVGTCLLSGPGAGAGPTATSVVSDVIDVARNMLKNASGRVPSFIHDENAEPIVQDPDDLQARYYLRFTVRDEPGVLSEITGKLSNAGVSIEKMFQNVVEGDAGAATVVILTHEAREGSVRKALRELDPLPLTLAPARLVRILG
jgi:homoserine dehydrogenase